MAPLQPISLPSISTLLEEDEPETEQQEPIPDQHEPEQEHQEPESDQQEPEPEQQSDSYRMEFYAICTMQTEPLTTEKLRHILNL